MSDFSPARVSAGVPSGGQFDVSARNESGVGLDVSDARSQAISDALGPGEPLTERQQRLLGILIDEDTYTDRQDSALSDMAFFGNINNPRVAVEEIATRIATHYAKQAPATGEGSVAIDINEVDGQNKTYSVGVYLGSGEGSWLTTNYEMSRLAPHRDRFDTDAGLRRAVAIAETADEDIQAGLSQAVRLGLISSPLTFARADADPNPPLPDPHTITRPRTVRPIGPVPSPLAVKLPYAPNPRSITRGEVADLLRPGTVWHQRNIIREEPDAARSDNKVTIERHTENTIGVRYKHSTGGPTLSPTTTFASDDRGDVYVLADGVPTICYSKEN